MDSMDLPNLALSVQFSDLLINEQSREGEYDDIEVWKGYQDCAVWWNFFSMYSVCCKIEMPRDMDDFDISVIQSRHLYTSSE